MQDLSSVTIMGDLLDFGQLFKARGIWCWDLNSQPLEHKPPPIITTRLGFLSSVKYWYWTQIVGKVGLWVTSFIYKYKTSTTYPPL